ncbi:MAG: branched-chain amino acid ABC transporter ATP-binding protein [Deltaproteobacteria bacterium]|nr:MAG: branched-chain amino acid ABC transporter ATP-binding protein [Deltaproteobacteria bacterium]
MLLEVRDLHISYGDIRAVNGVSFHLDQGELVSIIGANGAGKSSILNAIMGIVPLKAGSILFKGEKISSLPAHRRALSGIRMVPERARVFPRLTVFENLLVGAYRLRGKLPLEERISWLYELFPILGERKNQAASTLSGGEQQQLAIARALVSDPELLLVDEVSMGLMPKLVDRVFDLLGQLNREQKLSILLVEQNAVASLAVSHRAYVLETGSISYQGEAKDLMEDPEVKRAYLGR